MYDIPDGYYVYIEASAPRQPNDTAQLISPPVSASSNPRCLTFWYFMYGAHVNSLNIYIPVGANLGSPIWTRKGTQGNQWNQAQVTITKNKQFNVSLSPSPKQKQFNVHINPQKLFCFPLTALSVLCYNYSLLLIRFDFFPCHVLLRIKVDQIVFCQKMLILKDN